MSIREAILDSLPAGRMIRLEEVHEALAEHDRNAVDCALNAMIREGKLSRLLGHVGLPGTIPPPNGATREKPSMKAEVSTPPAPADEHLACKTCGQTKPLTDMMTFRGRPIRQCKLCRGKNGQKLGGRPAAPKVAPPPAAAIVTVHSTVGPFANIVAELRAQRAKLDAAIAALEALA